MFNETMSTSTNPYTIMHNLPPQLRGDLKLWKFKYVKLSLAETSFHLLESVSEIILNI